MKPRCLSAAKSLLVLAVLTSGLLSGVHRAAAAALGTAFTYQGHLNESGSPVNATVDLQFSLYDALTGGTQIGTTQTVLSVTVDKGLFTVQVDFGGSAFNGSARWLEIALRKPAGSGSYTTLTPRQPVTATPYAVFALSGGSITSVTGIDGLYSTSSAGAVSVGLAVDGVTTPKILDAAVTSPKIALPYAGLAADPGALWSVTNTGAGAAFSGSATGGNAADLFSTGGLALFATLPAGNPSDVIGAGTAGTGSVLNAAIINPASAAATILAKTAGMGSAISASLTKPTNASAAISTTTAGTSNALSASITNPANAAASVMSMTTGTGPAGAFMNGNPAAGATQDGIYSTTVAGTVAAAGVHAVGSGPGGPASAAALNIDSGAIDVSGPVPTRAVQCVPVPGGPWIPIRTCMFGCPNCPHAHVEGYYVDVPFGSPLIMVGGCNGPMDTMIIPSIETFGAPPPQSSYYIQVHSRLPGSCVFRVTRMGDPTGGCNMPAEMNRINVLMVNAL